MFEQQSFISEIKSGGGGAKVACSLIQEKDSGSIPTSPLQLVFYEISVDLARELNLIWHSRLPKITNPYTKHTVCYGAYFENKWYACAIWSDPIARLFNHKGYLELRRMSICKDAPKNTASRMLKIMTKMIKKKWPEIIKLISYQDTDVHQGTIYKASGWVIGGTRKGGMDAWSCNVRKRSFTQAKGDKIRWEKDLK